MDTRYVARNVLVVIGLAALALFLWKILPVRHALAALGSAANGDNVSRLARGTVTAFGGMLDALLVLVISFYLAANPRAYAGAALRLLPPASRPRV
ncbi:MAG TPA: hypothetical protein VLY46_11965, partial [Usitatibacter sp.]|nr:hypothetical protein [Usitatibacter sp.]